MKLWWSVAVLEVRSEYGAWRPRHL